jgi:hypothetical protein
MSLWSPALIVPSLHLFAQFFPDRVPNPHLGPKILAAICPKMDKAVTFLLKVALK